MGRGMTPVPLNAPRTVAMLASNRVEPGPGERQSFVFIDVRRGTRGVIRTSFGALAAACLLAALLVLPATASSGPTRLSDPKVSPAAGTTATTFVFTVRYRNHQGAAPDHVSVVVDGKSHLMTTTATSWKQPADFTYSSKLAVGSHSITFTSLDRDKFADSIAGGSVTVTAPPAPTPEPTPKATPKPTPKPTSRPEPTPAPTARATPEPAPESTPRATPRPESRATPTPSPDDSTGSTGNGSGSTPGGTPSEGPNAGEQPTASGDPGTAWAGGVPPGPDSFGPGGGTPPGPDGANGAPGGGPGSAGADTGNAATDGAGTGASGSGRGWGTLTAFTEILGLDPINPPALRLLPTLVGTAGGVTLMTAFLFFGKRRRDGAPPAPEEVLAAAAARGTGVAATSALAQNGAAVPQLLEPEADMPRWRRPSLMQARKADPLRNAIAAAPLTFDHGLVGPLEGLERRLIRYSTVTLLDAPDELRSAAVGSVAKDDEVQLLEKSGTYWLVLCPDGRRGWLHKMTLGDVVGDSPSPSASDTWGANGSELEDVDDDVLTAFLAARGQA